MDSKDTIFSGKLTINCKGRLIDLNTPRVMGILNCTPDSFYDGGCYNTEKEISLRAEEIISEGADIIDVGACSTRPGAALVSAEEEKTRLVLALKTIRKGFPDAIVSVDTYRAELATYAANEFGIQIINDISSGLLDEQMIPAIGRLRIPYIMMHMQGTPQNMQHNPEYSDVTRDVLAFFVQRIALARQHGIDDIIIDPGFGFGKTMENNFNLLRELRLFEMFGFPVLAGLSRKSMIWKSLQITSGRSLNGTTVLNTLALQQGARILRVHDVKEAVETVKLFTLFINH